MYQQDVKRKSTGTDHCRSKEIQQHHNPVATFEVQKFMKVTNISCSNGDAILFSLQNSSNVHKLALTCC